MKLSIVIPSYCSENYLSQCLSSIECQITEDHEVIVVDCSPHDKVEAICSGYGFVDLLKREDRFNPGEGRNIGAINAKGEYLVFIDADVVLDKKSLYEIEKCISQGYKVFGGALELNQDASCCFSSKLEHYYFNHESQSSRKIKKRKNLSSAFMIIEKRLFLEHDGFSNIPRMQDTELTERLVDQGQEIYFIPSVIGYQIQSSSFGSVLKKIDITGNNLYFIRYSKYSSFLSRVFFILFLPALMILKISRINARNLRYSFSYEMFFIYCPFMFVCGLYWMKGFYRGLFVSDGIDLGR